MCTDSKMCSKKFKFNNLPKLPFFRVIVECCNYDDDNDGN